MAKVMITFRSSGSRPSLADVQKMYGLSEKDIDGDFGVIEVDPADHLYTVMVDQDVASRIRGHAPKARVGGPYSNPKIAPFGL